MSVIMADRTEARQKQAEGRRPAAPAGAGGAGQAVFLAAGGTGGHVFPALALAQALAARGYSPHILTDSRARRYITAANSGLADEHIHVLDSATFAGKNPLKLAGSARHLLRGLSQALSLCRRFKPVLAVGFGGYPSLMPLWAARLRRIPTLIHEQNAVMGRANRFLAGGAKAIALGFAPAAGSAARLPPALAAKAHIIGNPLRPEVLAAAQIPYHPAGKNDPFHLLVFGGSQGASFFSQIMPAALALLPAPLPARLRLTQQARGADEAELRASYQKRGFEADIAPFFKDLPALMAQAQFIIARAGASTVAEIAAIGRPCLLVPYPQALDDDQKHNAAALAAQGGAELAEQKDLSAAKLAAILARAMELPQLLAGKARAAQAAGSVDAVDRLADLAETLIKAK